MRRIALPAEPRILVVVLRRLGDVLLTTPLIRSLRQAWPDAKIDALVFADTAEILGGNPDLNGVIKVPARANVSASLRLAALLWNRYELAISTQSGDRPTLFAWIAGQRHLGPVDPGLRGALRRQLLNRSIPPAPGVHRVEEVLQLADALGIGRVSEVVCPQDDSLHNVPDEPFAIVHAAPMFRYKQWTPVGWRALAAALVERGMRVLATGGTDAAEQIYLDGIWPGLSVERLDGRLSWGEIAGLLKRAKVYVGPDTSVTHLAAASGCPTVALFGPTDPRLWGPWPAGGLSEPWAATGTIQRRGNVWLAQNPLPCLPCQQEGCERHIGSFSACLDELSLCQVLRAVDQALEAPDVRLSGTGAPVPRPLRIDAPRAARP
jgi:heptosyltransferase III